MIITALGTKNSCSVAEIHRRLIKKDIPISGSTIYRAIRDRLEPSNLIKRKIDSREDKFSINVTKAREILSLLKNQKNFRLEKEFKELLHKIETET